MYERCACCKRPWARCGFFPDEIRGLLRKETPTFCAACMPHRGSNMQANAEHLTLWRDYVRDLEQEHADVVDGLRRRIQGLEQQLAERPEKIVEKWLNQDIVETAQAEAQRAFRSRARAWGGLLSVRVRHHETVNGRCRCSKPMKDCLDAQTVSLYGGLDKFENEQVALLRQGRRNDLPADHPARIDPKWKGVAERDLYEDDVDEATA